MASLSKRPGTDEDVDRSNKRHKTALPSGFFDNASSTSLEKLPATKPEQQGNNEDDDEWERFQAEMASDSSAPTTTTTANNSSKQRLELLGLGGASSIQADAVLANSGSPTVNEDKNGDSKESQTTEQGSKSSSRKTKIDKDTFAEEEAADGLLDQFETQEELYGRVDRMKELRKLRQENRNQAGKENGSKGILAYGESEDDETEQKDSESEDDEDEEDLWRQRGL